MAVHCLFFHLSMAFTVCALYCPTDGSGLLVLVPVNGFHCLRAVCSANDNILLVLPLVNGFHGLHSVLFNGWQRIARSSARQWLSRFARRFAPRMSAHCSYFHSSKASTTVCVPYCSADVSGLLIIPLVKVFHGLRAGLLNGCQRITHTSTFQRLSRRFAPRIALRMVLDRSYCCSSTAFLTVYGPFCSTDGIVLLVLPLVKGFHGLRAGLLNGCQRIAHSSAFQRVSQRFASRITLRMALDRSYFRWSMAFTTVCAQYFSADGSRLVILSLVRGFHGLHAVLLIGWQRIAHTSACQRLSQRFAYRITQRIVANCSYL